MRIDKVMDVGYRYRVSLDGYINDREGSVGLLYSDLEALRETEPLRESMERTGAVVMGRHSLTATYGQGL